MDYSKHYDRLIERARNRLLTGYVELHHVKPRCLGGTDERKNLVQLTAEEHYVAHQLLCKMHPTVGGLAYAVIAMSCNPWGHRRNKLYGWIRKRVALQTAIQAKKNWSNPEYRAKHKAAMKIVMADPSYLRKISAARTGRVLSAEGRANIAEAGRNRETRVFSDEARENMAEARRKTWAERKANGEHLLIAAKTKAARIKNGSYNFTAEHRAAIGLSMKGREAWNKGKPASDETKALQSLAKKGKSWSQTRRDTLKRNK